MKEKLVWKHLPSFNMYLIADSSDPSAEQEDGLHYLLRSLSTFNLNYFVVLWSCKCIFEVCSQDLIQRHSRGNRQFQDYKYCHKTTDVLLYRQNPCPKWKKSQHTIHLFPHTFTVTVYILHQKSLGYLLSTFSFSWLLFSSMLRLFLLTINLSFIGQ